MKSLVFNPDYYHYKNLPDERLLLNPLIDRPDKFKEESELIEFFKMCCEDYSPEFGIRYLLNVNLYPFQMAIIRSMFTHKFPLLLLTRGGGKTFLLACYAIIHGVLNPGTRIVLISASFRQSKLIFNEIKRIYDRAPLLRQLSAGAPTVSVDRCYFSICGSSVVALPLGQGDKIRGERGHVILVDEFDSVPIEIFDVVVRGFGATEADPWQKTKNLLLSEEQGKIWTPSRSTGNKIVLSGTAGYRNGTLYRMYSYYMKVLSNRIKGSAKEFVEILGTELDDKHEIDYGDYCVCQFAYDELPPGMMDVKMIENAKATMSKRHFEMEYMHKFADDSDGYFKAKDIEAATSKFPGGFGVLTTGKPGRKYAFGVDPARTTDRFAICVVEIGSPNKLVYSWTCQNQKYSYAVMHLRELIRKFPPLGIAMDAGGGGLAIEEMLSQRAFMKDNDIRIFRHDSDDKAIPASNKILYMFDFTSVWIEDANALLQKNIEDKVIMFPMGAAIEHSDAADDIITEIIELKKELSSIEITYTKTGKKHFDLMPAADLKRMGDEAVKHKDRYSSFLLANYLASRFGKLSADEKSLAREAYAKDVACGDWAENL